MQFNPSLCEGRTYRRSTFTKQMQTIVLIFHLWAESLILLIMIKVNGTNKCSIYTAGKEQISFRYRSLQRLTVIKVINAAALLGTIPFICIPIDFFGKWIFWTSLKM